MATEVLTFTGMPEEVAAFMNDNGLTLDDVQIITEGTTNLVVLFYEQEVGS